MFISFCFHNIYAQLSVKKLCQKTITKHTDSGLHFHVYIHEMQIYKHQEMSGKAYKLFFKGKIVTLNPDESIPMNSNNCCKD